jgi:biopolymer transport protein TolR
VVFQGDKSVSFESVAKAMAAVQSVGIEKIGIVTTGYAD